MEDWKQHRSRFQFRYGWLGPPYLGRKQACSTSSHDIAKLLHFSPRLQTRKPYRGHSVPLPAELRGERSKTRFAHSWEKAASFQNLVRQPLAPLKTPSFVEHRLDRLLPGTC